MWVTLLCVLSTIGSVFGDDSVTNSGELKDVPCPAMERDINDRQPDNRIAYFENIPTWPDCGHICKEYPGCEAWSWNFGPPDTKGCSLWRTVDRVVAVQGRISGTKDCPIT